jgi:hypothetical protein
MISALSNYKIYKHAAARRFFVSWSPPGAACLPCVNVLHVLQAGARTGADEFVEVVLHSMLRSWYAVFKLYVVSCGEFVQWKKRATLFKYGNLIWTFVCHWCSMQAGQWSLSQAQSGWCLPEIADLRQRYEPQTLLCGELHCEVVAGGVAANKEVRKGLEEAGQLGHLCCLCIIHP